MNNELTPAQPNRRRCRRMTPRNGTKAICLRGSMGLGRNLAISVLDLSTEGVRLLLKEPLQVGQEVEINLESNNQRRPVKIFGNIVWAIPTAEGGHCVGVCFQRSLRYAELTLLARI